MTSFRGRAIWFAAAVSVFILAVAGSALSVERASRSESRQITAHQVVADHDAVVSARPLADRSPLDLRPLHSRLLLLAWVGVLLVAAVLARTAGRTIEVRSRRVGLPPPTRQRLVRGPPAPSFV